MLRPAVVLSLCVLCVPFARAAETPGKAPPVEGEYQTLFNGQDLSGWDGDPQLWSVRDGVIHGETTPENPAKGNTFLIWQGGTVKDFELRLSFRCNATNNSGIQYRSRHITEGNPRNKWVVRGYQHEIRNEEKLPNVAGFIYDEGGKRGRICLVGERASWEPDGKRVISNDLISAEEFKELFNLDDWNDVVIVARGNHIRHYLNGRLVLDFTDNAPDLALTEGVLALQLHAGKPMWVEFKDIKLKWVVFDGRIPSTVGGGSQNRDATGGRVRLPARDEPTSLACHFASSTPTPSFVRPGERSGSHDQFATRCLHSARRSCRTISSSIRRSRASR